MNVLDAAIREWPLTPRLLGDELAYSFRAGEGGKNAAMLAEVFQRPRETSFLLLTSFTVSHQLLGGCGVSGPTH